MEVFQIIANVISGITAPIANAISTVKIANAQVQINRDAQLGETNRTFSTNAMLSTALPAIVLIIILLLVVYKK